MKAICKKLDGCVSREFLAEFICWTFGSLPAPLLNFSLRTLDQMLMDRASSDPRKFAAEMAADDRKR